MRHGDWTATSGVHRRSAECSWSPSWPTASPSTGSARSTRCRERYLPGVQAQHVPEAAGSRQDGRTVFDDRKTSRCVEARYEAASSVGKARPTLTVRWSGVALLGTRGSPRIASTRQRCRAVSSLALIRAHSNGPRHGASNRAMIELAKPANLSSTLMTCSPDSGPASRSVTSRAR
jgi:hypothetical protein